MKSFIKRKHIFYFILSILFSIVIYTNAFAVDPSIRVGLPIDVPTSTYGGTDGTQAQITSKEDFTISFDNIDPLKPDTIYAKANEEYTFTRIADKIRITKGINTWDSNGDVSINPGTDGLLIVKNVYFTPTSKYNRVYRGTLKVIKRPISNEKLRLAVINTLSVEKYLYGVVPREMPSSWSAEALKAQAVAARTYSISHIDTDKAFDVTATTLHQVYCGYGKLLATGTIEKSETANDKVDDTKGMVAKYGGNYISALFSSNAGGKTEDSKNVWGGDYPYLVSVDSHWDSIGGSTYSWSVIYDRFELEKRLKIFGIQGVYFENYTLAGRAQYLCVKTSAGVIKLSKSAWQLPLELKSRKVKVTTQNPTTINDQASYVEGNEVTVLTANGSQTIPLKEIYVLSGNSDIPTLATDYQAIGIDIIPTKYVFNGYGYGHGVGLSQWGANGMAKAGYNYKEILKHYYTGISVVDEY